MTGGLVLPFVTEADTISGPEVGDVILQPGGSSRPLPRVPEIRIAQCAKGGMAVRHQASEALDLYPMRKHRRVAIGVQRLPVEVEQRRRLPLEAMREAEGMLDQLGHIQMRERFGTSQNRLHGAKPWTRAALVADVGGIGRREGGCLGSEMLRALRFDRDDPRRTVRQQIQIRGLLPRRPVEHLISKAMDSKSALPASGNCTGSPLNRAKVFTASAAEE
jgi:hypothetical protein